MKILVLNNASPFVRGGAELFADQLVERLNATRGVKAELMRIPFRGDPPERLVEEIVLNRILRLSFVDRAIGLKFPAYLVPHPQKVLWLLHQFRQAYDLRDTGLSNLPRTSEGEEIVRVVRAADDQCFCECRKIFTNSRVTQERLKKYNGFDGTVLHPPLLDPERFSGGAFGDYVFAGGRVGLGKRQHLLVEAMRHVRNKLRLIVAGPPETEAYTAQLVDLVARHNLHDRVELRLGYRDRGEIANLVNGSLACAYLPIDEDSLGYVSMEGIWAGKPIVTSLDAGGLLDIVRDRETGYVVDPIPQSIALAFEELSGNLARAAEMGVAGKKLLNAKVDTWEKAIERLLS